MPVEGRLGRARQADASIGCKDLKTLVLGLTGLQQRLRCRMCWPRQQCPVAGNHLGAEQQQQAALASGGGGAARSRAAALSGLEHIHLVKVTGQHLGANRKKGRRNMRRRRA